MDSDIKTRASKPEKTQNNVKLTAQILIVIILAMLVASVINGTIFVSTRVLGASMNNTLYGGGDSSVPDGTYFDNFFFGGADRYGDKVVMVRTQEVQRGDIVVFVYEGEQWIKRVIAVAGDRLQFIGNRVYVNGSTISEPYALGTTYPTYSNLITIPNGTIFVMGDNRENSTDSRVIGAVNTSTIVGRVFMVIKKDTKKIVWAKDL